MKGGFVGLLNLEFSVYQFIRWDFLLRDLNDAGYNQATIARLLNLPVTTVKSWGNSSVADPRFTAGMCFLSLYANVFGEDATKNRIIEMRESVTRGAAMSE